jgi:hypothetical protein
LLAVVEVMVLTIKVALERVVCVQVSQQQAVAVQLNHHYRFC